MGIVDDRVIKVGDAGADDSKPGRPTRPWLSLQETGITEHSFAGSLFKTAPLVVLVLDIEGKIVLFNPYTEELTGFGLEEARGRDWFGVFLPDHVREQSRKRFKVALRARQRQGPAVTPIVTKGGHRRLVQWHDVALRDAQGGVVGLLAVGQDVTDRRQAERDLKESEKQLRKSDWAKDAVMRNTIEALTHPFYTIDAETYEVVLANSAAKKGMVKEGGACYALTHGRDEPCSGADHPCPLQIVKQSGEACTVEHVHGEDPGPPGIFEIYAYPLMDSEGKVAQIIEYSMDITERRRAEDRLELEKEQFRALVEESPLGVAMISPDGRYEYLSSKFVEMFGYTLEDIPTGLDWFSKAFPDPEYRKLVVTDWINYSKNKKTGAHRLRTFTVTCKDGLEKVIDFRPAALRKGRLFVLYEDVTERRLNTADKERVQARLRQAQKMEAIGTLAGGIAHDFNNILGAMIGYTELVLSGMAEDAPSRRKLEQVLKAGERAKSLVKQILSFSFHSEPEHKPIKIGPIITEALELIRASIPATVEIRQHIKAETGMVLADPTQIHQVLMNLCTNAASAMSHTGGLLEVGLDEVEFDKSMAAQYPELQPGRYQRLTVTDTGHGMDEKILARIYEPFFTTQKPEEGTGMGLSVVHGIVKNCGGAITVYSLPGTGTTFQLDFPLIQTRRPYLESAEDRPILRGTERILIVDDEAALVDIGQELLQGLGYQVTAMRSSLKALEAFKARPHEYDLVVTDQTMPQMTGFSLSRELLEIRPDIPIIICTGFSSHLSVDMARDIGIRRLAAKPLFARDIAKMIREVLEEKIEG